MKLSRWLLLYALCIGALYVVAAPSSRVAQDNAQPYTVWGPNPVGFGTGWGGAWYFHRSTNNNFIAGTTLADSTQNAGGSLGINSPNGRAWALYAGMTGTNRNDREWVTALRQFYDNLQPGQKFVIDYDNGYIESGGQVGFELLAGTNIVWRFYYEGGFAVDTYLVADQDGIHEPGNAGALVPFTGDGLHVEFELLTPTTYSVAISPANGGPTNAYNGDVAIPNLPPPGPNGISTVRLFANSATTVANARADLDHYVFFNNMAVTCGESLATTATATPNPACVGQDVQLSATGDAWNRFEWTGPDGFTSTNQNPILPDVSTNAAGTYVVTRYVADCSASASVDLEVRLLPASVIASNNSPICAGETLELYAEGGPGNFNWVGPAGFTSTLQNPTRPNAQAIHSGIYCVTLTGTNGCSTAPACTTASVFDPRLLCVTPPGVTCDDQICLAGFCFFEIFELPTGYVGWPYYFKFPGAGAGTPPYEITIVDGELPPGLTLSTEGVVSGIPTVAGTNYTFTITATDVRGCEVDEFRQKEYTLVIEDLGCLPMTITPATLPNAVLAQPYSVQLVNNGGVDPTFFIAIAGIVPPGLSLSSDGLLSGTPSAIGEFTFTLVVVDARGCSDERNYTVKVGCPPVTVTPVLLPLGNQGVAYSASLAAAGAVGPYTFAVTGGSLPPGLTLSSDGVLAGTPTEAGSIFTVTATSAAGCTGRRTYEVTIIQPTPEFIVTPTTLPGTQVGQAYNVTLGTAGAQTPISYAVTAGGLPVGLALSSDGVISGSAATDGFYQFTVTATDAGGAKSKQPYSLAVGTETGLPVLYTDPRRFAMLSSAAQTVLRYKYGNVSAPPAGAAASAAPVGTAVDYPEEQPGLPSLPNYLVNDPSSDQPPIDTQSETTLALGDEGVVICAFNDSGSIHAGHFTSYSVSLDSGTNWLDHGTLPETTEPWRERDAGDPVLVRGSDGVFNLVTLGYQTGETLRLFRSDNDGSSFLSWNVQTNILNNFYNDTFYEPGFRFSGDFQDKPWVAADRIGGTDYLYVAWRHFPNNFPGAGVPYGIRFVRSYGPRPRQEDPNSIVGVGQVWDPGQGILLADEGFNFGSNVQGAFVTVGPDHYVYVFWLDQSTGEGTPNIIRMRKSFDQGQTFQPAVTVATLITTNVNGNLNLKGDFRSNSFPQAVVNPQDGRAIYVVYNDTTGGADASEVYMVTSSDGGDTWSVPQRVNDDPTENDQWQPALAITPDGAKLFVGFYDRRLDPTNSLINTFGAIGNVDGANVTFGPNFRISNQSFPPAVGQDPTVNPTYMGDYDQAVADVNHFYYTWGDNHTGNPYHANQPDVRFTRIPVAGPSCPSVLSIDPVVLPDALLEQPYLQTITATGATAPVTFEIIAGSLPPGVTFAPSGLTALVSGTPLADGKYEFILKVTSAEGCSVREKCQLVVVGCPPITALPPNLLNPELGIPYTTNLFAEGGTWTISSVITNSITNLFEVVDIYTTNYFFRFVRIAGDFPPGIGMATNGVISGTATNTGTYPFRIMAIDDVGCTGERYYQMSIGCPTVLLSTNILPVSQVGLPYSASITASNGVAPFTFKVTSGSLPPGLSFSNIAPDTVEIYGVPTADSQSSQFDLTATDANGCMGTRGYRIFVAIPPPNLPTDVPAGVVGIAYSTQLAATGGTAPYNYAVTGGSPPAGVALLVTGELAGTPTTAGTFDFTVRVMDAVGRFSTRTYEMAVAQVHAQPDARIKKSGIAYVGNDIYNLTGSGQSAVVTAEPGSTNVFRIKIQNDGSATDSFRVVGKGDKPGFVVRYYEGTAGDVDITSEVVAGTYVTDPLEPGASTTNAKLIKMKVFVDPAAPSGVSVPYRVKAISTNDPTKADRVKAKVVVP